MKTAKHGLGLARKDAAGAVKVLRNILKDALAVFSVDESQCKGLDNALVRRPTQQPGDSAPGECLALLAPLRAERAARQ
jgi:hypothetical protein